KPADPRLPSLVAEAKLVVSFLGLRFSAPEALIDRLYEQIPLPADAPVPVTGLEAVLPKLETPRLYGWLAARLTVSVLFVDLPMVVGVFPETLKSVNCTPPAMARPCVKFVALIVAVPAVPNWKAYRLTAAGLILLVPPKSPM